MKISDLFEDRRKNNNNARPELLVHNGDDNEYKLHIPKQFKKARTKYSNGRSNMKLLDSLLVVLKKTGAITTNNVHPIKEPIRSDYTKGMETGWKVAWISRSDDLRLGYKVFGDRTIEVKFGTAKEIGYNH